MERTFIRADEGILFISICNKPGEVYPRRVCLRNAFEPVYPRGG